MVLEFAEGTAVARESLPDMVVDVEPVRILELGTEPGKEWDVARKSPLVLVEELVRLLAYIKRNKTFYIDINYLEFLNRKYLLWTRNRYRLWAWTRNCDANLNRYWYRYWDVDGRWDRHRMRYWARIEAIC